MSEKTHARYKRVLSEIAAGAFDPIALATEALRDRKPVAKPKVVKQFPAREYGPDRARRNYQEWCAAGKPPMRDWAKVVGLHPSTARRWIAWGEKTTKRDEYYESLAFKNSVEKDIARLGWSDWLEYDAGEAYATTPERKYWVLYRYMKKWGIPKGAPDGATIP